MCRSLEEENNSLSSSLETVQSQLRSLSQQQAAHSLIPHYRTAIVRGKAYAANLLEQLQREKEVSQALREQLETAYCDLKQVVEEKRLLLGSVSERGLQRDQKAYRDYRDDCFGVDNTAADTFLAEAKRPLERTFSPPQKSEGVQIENSRSMTRSRERKPSEQSPPAGVGVVSEELLKDELSTLDLEIGGSQHIM